MNLNPGDKVRIVRKIAVWPGNRWVSAMDQYINNGVVYTIRCVYDNRSVNLVEDWDWTWPDTCFQKAGKPKPKPRFDVVNPPISELPQRAVTMERMRTALLGPEAEVEVEEEDMDDLDFVEDDYDDIDDPADERPHD